MGNSKKNYIKAMNYYQDGYIEKALNLCEKNISENICDSSSINLKGLLYYLKGDLQSAKSLWKLNHDVNNDTVSQIYMENIKEDEKRLTLFIKALKHIENMEFNDAIKILRICEESDFNSINIGNNLAFCLIKQGYYEEAAAYIDKVLSMDKKNDQAENSKKLLKQCGCKVRANSRNKTAFIIISTILLFVIVTGIVINNESKKISKTPSTKIQVPISKPKVKNEVVVKKPVPFPYEEINEIIISTNIDFEKLYAYIEEWKGKATEEKQKVLIAQGEAILKDKGVIYFYDKGYEYIKNKDFTKALASLNTAYKYGNGNYPYEHILYFLGSVNMNLNNSDEAKALYEKYDKLYPKGEYEATVLYELLLMNKTTDINKSKQYASRIRNNFSDSIYNNTVVDELLK